MIKIIKKNWISQPSKQVLHLALPLTGSRLLSTITGFLCFALLSRYNSNALAASALISSTQLVVLIAGMAILLSTNILVGYSFGKKQFDKIANITHQSIILALCISITLVLVFRCVKPILLYFHQPEHIVLIASTYFDAFSYGVPAILVFAAIQQTLFSIKKQNIAVICDILSLILTLFLAISFIYGRFGFSEFGIVGLAYALTAQAWVITLLLLAYLAFHPTCKKYNFFKEIKFCSACFFQLFNIGWPISLCITGEISSLFAITVMAGWLGVESLNIQHIATQYLLLLVVPIFGISQATSVLSSHLIGAKQSEMLSSFGYSAIKLGFIFTSIALVVFTLFPKALISIFVNTQDTSKYELIKTTTSLLLIVCTGQFFDALRNICSGSLRSMGITIQPMLITIAYIWIFSIPLAYYLGFKLGFGLVGVNIAYNIGMILAGINLFHLWSQKTIIFSSNNNRLIEDRTEQIFP